MNDILDFFLFKNIVNLIMIVIYIKMSITQDQIKKIAKNLCKLPWEDIKLAGDVNKILSYVEMLNEVDTTWVEPTINVVSKKSTLRKDMIIKNEASAESLLKCSSQKIIANQIAIWNIMK